MKAIDKAILGANQRINRIKDTIKETRLRCDIMQSTVEELEKVKYVLGN